MNVGQLAINLGIKGTEKAIGALKGVTDSLGQTASMSLEAKAGILAAVYAMEKLISSAGGFATGMMNFNAMTGVSIETLERYQYAAKQAGISNEDVEKSFRGLQSVITNVQLGKGVPEFFARISQLTGLRQEDLTRLQAHPEQLIQKLQEYAQKEKNVGFRNEALKSMGMSEAMIGGLARNTFNQHNIDTAPILNTNQIKSIDKANIAFQNMMYKMDLAMGKFVSGHGGNLVADLDKITTAVIKLVDALTLLADKLGVFKGLDKIAAQASDTINSTTELIKKPNEKNADSFLSNVSPVYMLGKLLNTMMHGAGEKLNPMHSLATPLAQGAGATNNVNTTVNNHFQHDGKDHQKTTHDFKKAVKDAWAQTPKSQGG